MGSDVWIAIIAALGASGVASALLSWIKDRNRNSAEVTQIIREMSKETVADAAMSLKEIRADLREVRSILEELVQTVEREVLPLLPEQHEEVRRHLRSISTRAKDVV